MDGLVAAEFSSENLLNDPAPNFSPEDLNDRQLCIAANRCRLPQFLGNMAPPCIDELSCSAEWQHHMVG